MSSFDDRCACCEDGHEIVIGVGADERMTPLCADHSTLALADDAETLAQIDECHKRRAAGEVEADDKADAGATDEDAEAEDKVEDEPAAEGGERAEAMACLTCGVANEDHLTCCAIEHGKIALDVGPTEAEFYLCHQNDDGPCVDLDNIEDLVRRALGQRQKLKARLLGRSTAKLDVRKQVRVSKETSADLDALVKATGHTENKVINGLIVDGIARSKQRGGVLYRWPKKS
jgi:hypothetical protein